MSNIDIENLPAENVKNQLVKEIEEHEEYKKERSHNFRGAVKAAKIIKNKYVKANNIVVQATNEFAAEHKAAEASRIELKEVLDMRRKDLTMQ